MKSSPQGSCIQAVPLKPNSTRDERLPLFPDKMASLRYTT